MKLYSEAQMKDCWEAGERHGCDLWVSENVSAPTETPNRDQYLSTVKPVEVDEMGEGNGAVAGVTKRQKGIHLQME